MIFFKRSDLEKKAKEGDVSAILELARKGKRDKAIKFLEEREDDPQLRKVLFDLYLQEGKELQAYRRSRLLRFCSDHSPLPRPQRERRLRRVSRRQRRGSDSLKRKGKAFWKSSGGGLRKPGKRLSSVLSSEEERLTTSSLMSWRRCLLRLM